MSEKMASDKESRDITRSLVIVKKSTEIDKTWVPRMPVPRIPAEVSTYSI